MTPDLTLLIVIAVVLAGLAAVSFSIGLVCGWLGKRFGERALDRHIAAALRDLDAEIKDLLSSPQAGGER